MQNNGDTGGAPMSELEYLKMKMNQKTDQSLDSTRQMVKLVGESQQAGASTLNQLHEQGQQLKRVDGNLDVMRDELTEAQQNIEELDKCCGLCVLPWKKKKAPPKSAAFKTPSSHGSGMSSHRNGAGDPYNSGKFNPVTQQQGPPVRGQYITRITNDAREDEMEENLGQVATMVTELKSMATDMGTEIRSHNQILERIDGKVEANQEQLRDAQQAADKIVGQKSKPKDESMMSSEAKWKAAQMLLK